MADRVRGRLARELTDPWGPMLGAILGGVTWALSAPIAAAVGVGAVVYGVKVVSGALLDRSHETPSEQALARPQAGSGAAYWLTRAEQAVADLQDQARTELASASTVAPAARAAEEAARVLATMRRLGAQSEAVATALSRSDAPGLDAEAARLQQRAAATPGNESAQQSARAVADRLAVRDRMRGAQEQLVARMESAALGLEGLVARVAELRAMATDTGVVDPTDADLASLTTEVEGLRQGLVESEQATRGVLGQG